MDCCFSYRKFKLYIVISVPPADFDIAVNENLKTIVKVQKVGWYGKLELVPYEESHLGHNPDIIVARMPIPNIHAHYKAWYYLVGKIFDFQTINGSTLEYNNFYDNHGNNVTYSLYMDIATTLSIYPPAGLPQIYQKGYCRISPLCSINEVYVQTLPPYVDAISYVIYSSVGHKTLQGIIQPAEHIRLDEMYIMSRHLENYRVAILPTCPTPESEFLKLGRLTEGLLELKLSDKHQPEEAVTQRNRKSEQINQRCLSNEVVNKEVMVSLLDFGGPPMKVDRKYLYCVETVDPELRRLPSLAFRVNVGNIYGSSINNHEWLVGFRTRQKLLSIKTVAVGTTNIPPTIDIIYECITDELY